MITFLIHGNFTINARLLDDKRLAKQRVEGYQILDAIQNNTKWNNHPAVKAWKYYVDALKYYINCIIIEWIRRGGQNNLALFDVPILIMMPWWAQWDRLHQSHRAMLMRKNPFHYHDKFIVEPEYYLYGYIWPAAILYKDRFRPLVAITNPIPDELVNPIYCQALLKSGKRIGQSCNCLVKDKYQYCNVHRKTQL